MEKHGLLFVILSPNAKVTHGTGLFMSDKTGKIL